MRTTAWVLGVMVCAACGHSPRSDLKAAQRVAVVEFSTMCGVDLGHFNTQSGLPALDALIAQELQNTYAAELLPDVAQVFLTRAQEELKREFLIPQGLMDNPAYQALPQSLDGGRCALDGTRALGTVSDEELAALAKSLGVDGVMLVRLNRTAVRNMRVTLVMRLQAETEVEGRVVTLDGHRPMDITRFKEGSPQEMSAQGFLENAVNMPVRQTVKDLSRSAMTEAANEVVAVWGRMTAGPW